MIWECVEGKKKEQLAEYEAAKYGGKREYLEPWFLICLYGLLD
jgi:hypothetical protein